MVPLPVAAPVGAPKLALRSSTKPAGPEALLVTVSTVVLLPPMRWFAMVAVGDGVALPVAAT